MKQHYFLLLFLISTLSFAQQPYYDSIDFSETGLTLKGSLKTLMENTHTNMLTYTPGVWNALKATDFNPNDTSNVILIYGWEDGTDGDCTNDYQRGINDNGGTNCFDWNREHTYPRSLGTPNLGSTGPGADALMLRPSDVQRNALRGNKKFADGVGNSGVVSGNWYPGDEFKGDIARIMMYMYMYYDDRCLPTNVGVGSNADTPDDMIDLFLQWNVDDPVSDFERMRNEYHDSSTNANAQGNRNPFIDNPALATVIWGGPEAEDTWGTLLSVKEFTKNTFAVYPNPVKGELINVAINNTVNYTIYNILGKQILEGQLSESRNTINVANLTKGIYILKLTTKTGEVSKKIIKQ